MYKTLKYEWLKDDGFIKITLNRPEIRNAVSLQLAEELNDAINQAERQDKLKFLVLTGEGEKAFCSGGDLHDFHGEMTEMEVAQLLSKVKAVLHRIATFPVPTICLLNGNSRGGGCELATACDFRFAKEKSNHGFVQGKLGIIPGWGGGALLHKRIESSWAHYWLVSSEVKSAQTLHQWGWIHSVYPILNRDTIKQLLTPFIEKTHDQMRVLKYQLLSQPQFRNLNEEMEEEMLRCSKLWNSKEHKEAVQAFFTKDRKK